MAARWNSSRAPESSAQAQSLEAVMGLQVCKAHLNLFTLITRFPGTPVFHRAHVHDRGHPR